MELVAVGGGDGTIRRNAHGHGPVHVGQAVADPGGVGHVLLDGQVPLAGVGIVGIGGRAVGAEVHVAMFQIQGRLAVPRVERHGRRSTLQGRLDQMGRDPRPATRNIGPRPLEQGEGIRVGNLDADPAQHLQRGQMDLVYLILGKNAELGIGLAAVV